MPKVTLLAHTPNPEKLVAAAAKLCYSPASIDGLLGGLSPERVESFLQMLMDVGHHSPLEHAVFTFGIEGVSRALLAQITRHRIASYSVQSQRYVAEHNFDYVVPPAVLDDREASAAFEQSMAEAGKAYDKLTDILYRRYAKQLEDEGKASPAALSAAKKQAIEDARFVLPNACDTKMVVTMNTRSLRGFFAQRCCTRAQWEIRALADEMLRLCKEASPLLFMGAGPSCVSGRCPESKMSCGKQAEVRERYADKKR